MKIDHIGIVVRSIEKAIADWERFFGYRQATEIVVNTRQKARVVFLENKDSITIKLIQPSENSSSLVNALKSGGGLHHLCFKCESIENTLVKMKNEGMRILVPPQPGEAFDGGNIAFVYAGHGLNIEIIDTDIRAKRIGHEDKADESSKKRRE